MEGYKIFFRLVALTTLIHKMPVCQLWSFAFH